MLALHYMITFTPLIWLNLRRTSGTTRGGCGTYTQAFHDKDTACVPVGYRHLSLRGKPQTQRQTANTLFTSSKYTRGACGNFVNMHY